MSAPVSALVCCVLQAEYEIQNVVISNVYTFIKSVQTFTMEFNSSLTYPITRNMRYFLVNWNIYKYSYLEPGIHVGYM
jgi:hypothetical protein